MQWHGINQNQKFHRKVHDCDDQDLPQLLTVHPREQQHPAGKAYKKINLVVCKVDSMAEEKCDKCSFVGDKAAMQQHRNRKIPCDAGQYLCRKNCGKLLKSADTRRNHEKTCDGPKKTREELQIENTSLQAQLTNQEEASNQQMAIASSASVSAVSKLVSNIQSNPERVLNVDELKIHHAVGEEATRHLKGQEIGLKLSSKSAEDAFEKWFWLLREHDLSENHNILLVPGMQAVLCLKEGWTTFDTEVALLTVFRADVTKLYHFLGTTAENVSETVANFRMDVVLHKAMAEVNNLGNKGPLFMKWKQAITQPLSTLTAELYFQDVAKPFASTVEYSRQRTCDTIMGEIRQQQDLKKSIEHKIDSLLEEIAFLFKTGKSEV